MGTAIRGLANPSGDNIPVGTAPWCLANPSGDNIPIGTPRNGLANPLGDELARDAAPIPHHRHLPRP